MTIIYYDYNMTIMPQLIKQIYLIVRKFIKYRPACLLGRYTFCHLLCIAGDKMYTFPINMQAYI